MDPIIDALLSVLRPIGITEIVLQFMLVNAILGVSIYLTLYTGMFSLANAGFMAIGAYAGVLITTQLDLPLFAGLIGGMVLAGIIALPIGYPVLRLKDIYLAIATIGFGEVVRIMILNFDSLVASTLSNIEGERVRFELLGGARGIRSIPKLTETWHLMLFLLVIMFLLIRLHRSRFGRAMAAIRQDESAAANMGIDVVYIKNAVFILSAMLAGAAGAFNGHLTRIVTPDAFGFDKAVDILAFAVLGGMGTWVGPIVGGLVLTALPEVLRFLKEYRGVFNGLVLLVVIVYLPGGLINPTGWRKTWRWLTRRISGDPPETPAPSAPSNTDGGD
ncbi:MAG: branched-chain amino acid ABC transporter permease [Aggregatilineales bacterium]